MIQTFPISGMTCGSCVTRVQARLRENPEIASAEVTLEPPRAVIISKRQWTRETLTDWLRPLGHYEISGDALLTEPQNAVELGSKLPDASATTYRPLLILLAYLILVIASVMLAYGDWDGAFAMRLFMGGFFVAFSFFKMLDLRGFADAYRGYDIVARAVPAYGRVYPFIELALGLGYLANWQPRLLNPITVIVMGVSLIGVLRAVISKTAIRCACLGTVFNLPMSTVTIIEDGLMVAMAAWSWWKI